MKHPSSAAPWSRSARKISRDTEDSIRDLLRETFKDGPRAAARAQAVYAIWKLGVTETGREVHPISYAGAEWQNSKDKWSD
jgi:hypothetical protein